MKKLSPVLIALLAMTSCDKNASISPNQNNVDHHATASYTGGVAYRLLDESLHDCVDQTGNCHPNDVIVKKNKLEVFKGAIATGDPSDVVDYFETTEGEELIPGFEEPFFADVKDNILSGDYTFIASSNNDVNELGNQLYFLVPASNPVASAKVYVVLFQVDHS